jgi:large subunit ribosomal protein L29
MKTAEIRELSDNEIQKKLRDTRQEHVQLRMRKQTGQVEHPHQFKQLRHEIARLETILREKKIGAA